MQYINNYLKNVIFRIDFAQPLVSSKKSVDNLYNLIKIAFQKRESIKRTTLQAEIVTNKKSNRVTQSQQTVTDYRFSDESQSKILMLEPLSNINLTFNIYKNSTELKNVINLVVNSVIEVYGDVEIKRTGLRYINDIVLPEGNAFDWAPFINSSLISSLEFVPEKTNLSRAMGIIELNRENHKILFQYGMYNPEYPNSIGQKVFVLDYDCYTTEILNTSNINDMVNILQKDEEELFERSIEDGLREKMVVIVDE
ncbi:MAG: TIGR04255 family protein [Methanotrichaceae archaeon]|nr:TIGR04255 family protein [Methanotrichaceae archaeon]